MTWSYDESLGTPKDLVRFYAGDTVSAAPQISDEEIAGVLARQPNVLAASADVCDHLASKYARLSDIAIDDIRKSLSQRSTAFTARANQLRDQSTSVTDGGTNPVLFAGGITVAQKSRRASNGALVQPRFTRDRDEFQSNLSDDD